MAWLKKGMCGIDLKKQTVAISIFYSILALLGLVSGFIAIENPERFFSQADVVLETNVKNEEESEASAFNNVTSEKTENLSSTEKDHYEELIRIVRNNGIKVVIGALITLIFSLLLIVGVKTNKSIWFVPWLVQQSVELFLSVAFFMIRVISGRHYSFLEISVFIVYAISTSYFTFAILSHYFLLKRMTKHSNEIINSVMEGGTYSASSVNYERLQEEISRSEMTPMPSAPVRERPTEDNHRRDDIMYFSID